MPYSILGIMLSSMDSRYEIGRGALSLEMKVYYGVLTVRLPFEEVTRWLQYR
jgi:hypothetical protein